MRELFGISKGMTPCMEASFSDHNCLFHLIRTRQDNTKLIQCNSIREYVHLEELLVIFTYKYFITVLYFFKKHELIL